MTHCLKTWKEFYELQQKGEKPWELRKNDRNYKPGDTFISQEWDKVNECYTGRETAYTIMFMLSGAKDFGLMDGYCILTLKEKESGY